MTLWTKAQADKSPGGQKPRALSAWTKAPAFKMHERTKAPVLNLEYNFVSVFFVINWYYYCSYFGKYRIK